MKTCGNNFKVKQNNMKGSGAYFYVFCVFNAKPHRQSTHTDQSMKCPLRVSICLYKMKIKARVVEGCPGLRRARSCLQNTACHSFIVHLVHVVGHTQQGATTLGSRDTDVTIQDHPWVALTGLYTHRCAGP